MVFGLGSGELVVFLLVVGLALWAAADILRREPEWGIYKGIRLLAVIVVPVLGPLAYLLVGRARRSPAATTR